jgi:hypothetical protein
MDINNEVIIKPYIIESKENVIVTLNETDYNIISGDQFEYSISILNNNPDEELKITRLDVKYPTNLKIINYTGFNDETDNTLKFTGEIESKKTQIVSFKAISKTSGLSKIDYTIKSFLANMQYSFDGTSNINTTTPELEPKINIDVSINEKEKTIIIFPSIENNKQMFPFKDINCELVGSNGIINEMNTPVLVSNAKVDLSKEVIKIEPHMGFILNLICNYKTEYNENIETRIQKIINSSDINNQNYEDSINIITGDFKDDSMVFGGTGIKHEIIEEEIKEETTSTTSTTLKEEIKEEQNQEVSEEKTIIEKIKEFFASLFT